MRVSILAAVLILPLWAWLALFALVAAGRAVVWAMNRDRFKD
jgi:hypothetical protein